VNNLTGASPTVALLMLWTTNGKGDVAELQRLEKEYGVKSGSDQPETCSSRRRYK